MRSRSALAFYCGNEWLTLFFHVNVLAGLMLPGRDAYAAIAGPGALMAASGSALGLGWSDIGQGVLSTAALGLLFAAFGRNIDTIAELRAAREEIARLAVSEERLRFARDLHDLLGHSLSLITLKSELAGRLLTTSPQRAATEVRDIEGVARQALREVRDAVAGYRQPTLGEELAGAQEMLEAAGIACRIENGAGELDNTTDAVLAWTVREGVTNVIRHSQATRCEIRLSRDGEKVSAEVTDDGESSGREGIVPGSGLSGLAERVAANGGEWEAGPLAEGGFRLRVSLPPRGGPRSGRAAMTIRVLLAEDQAMVRGALSALARLGRRHRDRRRGVARGRGGARGPGRPARTWRSSTSRCPAATGSPPPPRSRRGCPRAA